MAWLPAFIFISAQSLEEMLSITEPKQNNDTENNTKLALLCNSEAGLFLGRKTEEEEDKWEKQQGPSAEMSGASLNLEVTCLLFPL